MFIWGPLLEQSKHKNKQRLYLSEQTDGSVPNTLVIANCDVVKPKVAAAEHISQFNEEARSPFVKKFKTILHPGERATSMTTQKGKNPGSRGILTSEVVVAAKHSQELDATNVYTLLFKNSGHPLS
ncbi:hypothetical protein Tco_0682650 [Tanacetum coccineum]|uniref:Uncharacterized protein n=1 Tax=Tanacetum coccineum TaxID=301880 RepID=A0ABQ4XRT6_9ASTR